MEKLNALQIMAKYLREGDTESLKNNVIAALQHGGYDANLLTSNCMTSFLAFNDMPVLDKNPEGESLVSWLTEKATAGANRNISQANFDKRVETARKDVRILKDVAKVLAWYKDYTTNEKQKGCIEKVLTNLPEKEVDPIAALMTVALTYKATYPEDVAGAIEFEKTLEPFVIAFTDRDKFKYTVNSAKAKGNDYQYYSHHARYDVRNMLGKTIGKENADELLHDIAINAVISQFTEQEEWNIALSTDPQNGMQFIDEKGETKYLFPAKSNASANSSFESLLKNGTAAELLAAFEKITDSINKTSSISSPENALKMLTRMVMLCDNLEIDNEKLACAIADPLVDILSTFERTSSGKETIRKIVDDSMGYANQIAAPKKSVEADSQPIFIDNTEEDQFIMLEEVPQVVEKKAPPKKNTEKKISEAEAMLKKEDAMLNLLRRRLIRVRTTLEGMYDENNTELGNFMSVLRYKGEAIIHNQPINSKYGELISQYYKLISLKNPPSGDKFDKRVEKIYITGIEKVQSSTENATSDDEDK